MEPVAYRHPVMGMEFVGNSANEEIQCGLWQKSNQRADEELDLEEGNCFYGVCSMLLGSKAGWMEYVAGMKVSKTVKCPQGNGPPSMCRRTPRSPSQSARYT